MILLDTDTFTLLTRGHQLIVRRLAQASERVGITIITRIETLQGRIAFLIKAANGEQLLRAQEWLLQTEADLSQLTTVPLDAAAATEFDRLRGVKGLKRIGRCDLLIASIALANKATLVTRNLKDYQKVPDLKLENWAD